MVKTTTSTGRKDHEITLCLTQKIENSLDRFLPFDVSMSDFNS
jgi:hypothetical protein